MVASVLFLLRTLAFGWLVAAWRLVQRVLAANRRWKNRGEGRDRKASRARCVPIDHQAFKRPDPLIYDQSYLMKLGLAVTWDNPDIQLYRDGVPIPSSLLQPDSDYTVVARIWNASLEGPVVQMPVHFSYLDFGIGTISVPIATTKLSIGVKGSASEPGYAHATWHTPGREGHYCLQVHLDPVDDANFANNLGQENTHVGSAHSPAIFTFALRNDTRSQHRYRFEVDAYQLPPQEPCDRQKDTPEERRRRAAAHAAGRHPLPAGWSVEVTPADPVLAAGDQIEETAVVTPPSGWTGAQRINVNAFREDDVFVGGVTLIVEEGS